MTPEEREIRRKRLGEQAREYLDAVAMKTLLEINIDKTTPEEVYDLWSGGRYTVLVLRSSNFSLKISISQEARTNKEFLLQEINTGFDRLRKFENEYSTANNGHI